MMIQLQNAVTNFVFAASHNVDFQANYRKLTRFLEDPAKYLKLSRRLQEYLPLNLGDRIVIAICNFFGFEGKAAEKIARLVKPYFDKKYFPQDLKIYAMDPDCSFFSFHPEGRPVSISCQEKALDVMVKLAKEYKAKTFYLDGEPYDISLLARFVRSAPIPELDD